MKFERQRIHQSIPDKFEVINQQFLTFRNNPNIENTGRSVYSQPFDYKSLEKYQKLDEEEQPKHNFRKNIKNIRSQEKYKQLKEEATLAQMIDENNQTENSNPFDKNEDLKVQLSKLIKNIKREQKKQTALDDEIDSIKNQIQQIQRQAETRNNDMEALAEISEQNSHNCNDMIAQLQFLKQKAIDYQQKLKLIDDSLIGGSVDFKTNRNKDLTSKDLTKKLQIGIQQLQILSANLRDSIRKYEEEINEMEEELQQISFLDKEIKG